VTYDTLIIVAKALCNCHLTGGAHPVQIQMLLGHASLACLSQYLQVTITDMKEMHQKSRLGR